MRLVQDDPSLAVRLYRNVMVILREKLMVANDRIDGLLQAEPPPDSDDPEES